MIVLILLGVLAHQGGEPSWPTISLELRSLPGDRPVRRKPGSQAELDDLMARSTKPRRGSLPEMSLTVRASQSGDVRFNKEAFTLEIQDLAGTPLRSNCIDKYALEEPDYVRLPAGQTMILKLPLTGHCGPVVPGQRYAVVGVFTGDEGEFPFHLPPHEGATLVTRRVESNRIILRWPQAAR
jgi:hypothetical protein